MTPPRPDGQPSVLRRALPFNDILLTGLFMLQINGAVRTLIAWFTLFFVWSAYVLWFHGVALMKFIMSTSSLFIYDLSIHTQGNLPQSGVPFLLLTLIVLAAGATLASATLFIASVLAVCRQSIRRAAQHGSD